VKQGNTQGISPKAVLAVVFPLAELLVALALVLFAGLDFTTAAAIVAVSAPPLAGLGAYKGVPGTVSNVSAGPPSDDLLMADHDVRNRLTGPGIQTKRPG
jgi:hypothetical protein